jgi:CBS domain-containing protein
MTAAARPVREMVGEWRMPVLTIKDIMTENVRCARERDTLRDVHALMRMSGFRHVPIVDDEGKLTGIVSDRDIHLAWHNGNDQPVSAFMTRYTQWARPEARARDVAARMMNDKIGCMPVVDEKNHVVGIVTETDFLRVAHRALSIQEAMAEE